MIFGMDNEKINSLGAIHTSNEIKHQPKLWEENFKMTGNKMWKYF